MLAENKGMPMEHSTGQWELRVRATAPHQSLLVPVLFNAVFDEYRDKPFAISLGNIVKRHACSWTYMFLVQMANALIDSIQLENWLSVFHLWLGCFGNQLRFGRPQTTDEHY